MSDVVPGGTPGQNLSRQTLSGLSWVYLGTGLGMVLQLVYTSAMSRLLDPVDFGLIASAQVVLHFGKYASELGLGPALVQRETLTTTMVRAGVTSSALLGVGLTALMVLLAPALEVFFDSAEVVPVFRVLALTLLLNTLTIVPVSLLRRQFRFRALAMTELVSFAVGYIGIGLTLGLLGAGVWSLVAAATSQVLLLAVGAHLLARPPIRPSFAFREVASLYRFGGMVSVITLMEYAMGLVPTAVIGRYAGIASVGHFNRASLVIELPLQNLISSLTKVLFPAISRIQNDRPRVKEAYLTAMRTSAALIIPLCAGAAVAAPQLVGALLGQQWTIAASLVPATAAAGAFAFLAHYGGIVAEALDVLRAKVVLTGAVLVAMAVGMLLVPSGDVLGYVLVVVGAQALAAVSYGWLMSRMLGVTWRQQVGLYLPGVVAGTAVAGVIWLVTQGMTGLGTPVVVVLVVQILTGGLTLLPLAWYGPLRPARLDVLLRLRQAELHLSSSTAARRVIRVLQVGGEPGWIDQQET